MATATATKKKSKIQLQPLEDRIVLKRLDAEEKTAGGILLPEAAREKPQRGEIVATGPGKMLDNGKRAKLEVEQGDTVLFGKYSGTDVKVEGVEYIILRESDVLAKIEK